MKTMQSLYFETDYRLISYEPNGCWHNIAGKEKFYYLSEIVLKKSDGKKLSKLSTLACFFLDKQGKISKNVSLV